MKGFDREIRKERKINIWENTYKIRKRLQGILDELLIVKYV